MSSDKAPKRKLSITMTLRPDVASQVYALHDAAMASGTAGSLNDTLNELLAAGLSHDPASALIQQAKQTAFSAFRRTLQIEFSGLLKELRKKLDLQPDGEDIIEKDYWRQAHQAPMPNEKTTTVSLTPEEMKLIFGVK